MLDYHIYLCLPDVVHWFSFVCLNFTASSCDLDSHKAKTDRVLFPGDFFITMIVSGLSGSLSRCPQLPPRGLESRRVRVMAFSVAGKCIQKTAFPSVERYAQLIITF